MTDSIEEIRQACWTDSKAWFPDVHETPEKALIHSALGLSGETGEAVDVIKKWHRGRDLSVSDFAHERGDKLGSELADVAIYLLHICSATGISLADEIDKKRKANLERFG